MQFLITAYDGTDPQAPARRQAVRAEHLAGAERMYREKTLLYAAAILNDAGGMAGSAMIVDFPSREAMQAEWLDNEPYITGDVWRKIEIVPCAVPGFCLSG
ncbi:YciI family protein [Ruminococcaceae bacterium OttesenSCG-928-D13]|nr:YciI family protein [Ruminococcaceae bacterium OttesenSCG-928-D13]